MIDAVDVAIAIARAEKGPKVSVRVLCFLTDRARDVGIATMLQELVDDPGLLIMVSDPWFLLRHGWLR